LHIRGFWLATQMHFLANRFIPSFEKGLSRLALLPGLCSVSVLAGFSYSVIAAAATQGIS
jgi:hypothetical protein